MTRRREGVAAYPEPGEHWNHGDVVPFHGHLTHAECLQWWDDDALTLEPDVAHRHARTLPPNGDGWRVVCWPYPAGRGAYPVTLATVVKP